MAERLLGEKTLSATLMSPGENEGTLIITQKGLFLHAHGGEVSACCSHIGSSPHGMEVTKIMICRAPLHMQGMYLGYLEACEQNWHEISKLVLCEDSMKGYEDNVFIPSGMKQMFCLLCVPY